MRLTKPKRGQVKNPKNLPKQIVNDRNKGPKKPGKPSIMPVTGLKPPKGKTSEYGMKPIKRKKV